MIELSDDIKKSLIDIGNTKGIFLEGNVIRMFDSAGDDTFKSYLDACLVRDKEVRKKRLEITKQIQIQNKELSELNEANKSMMTELQETIKSVEENKCQIETQNKELMLWKSENEKISEELKEQMAKSDEMRMDAERAKENALNDLDVMQKKSQTELIGNIVRAALIVILSIGVIVTVMYILSMAWGKETEVIGSTWSNITSILLTNSFSIIGTIMGVKYAQKDDK